MSTFFCRTEKVGTLPQKNVRLKDVTMALLASTLRNVHMYRSLIVRTGTLQYLFMMNQGAVTYRNVNVSISNVKDKNDWIDDNNQYIRKKWVMQSFL